MKTVTVNASKTYDIHIGGGLLASLGQEAARLGKASKACIVSDSTVWPLYGAAASERLLDAGFTVCSYVFLPERPAKTGRPFWTC